MQSFLMRTEFSSSFSKWAKRNSFQKTVMNVEWAAKLWKVIQIYEAGETLFLSFQVKAVVYYRVNNDLFLWLFKNYPL